MSGRLWHHRVVDIIEAIQKVQQYVEGMNFEAFHQDPKTIDAVIRNFIVIGEAARNVPNEVAAHHSSQDNSPAEVAADARRSA